MPRNFASSASLRFPRPPPRRPANCRLIVPSRRRGLGQHGAAAPQCRSRTVGLTPDRRAAAAPTPDRAAPARARAFSFFFFSRYNPMRHHPLPPSPATPAASLTSDRERLYFYTAPRRPPIDASFKKDSAQRAAALAVERERREAAEREVISLQAALEALRHQRASISPPRSPPVPRPPPSPRQPCPRPRLPPNISGLHPCASLQAPRRSRASHPRLLQSFSPPPRHCVHPLPPAPPFSELAQRPRCCCPPQSRDGAWRARASPCQSPLLPALHPPPMCHPLRGPARKVRPFALAQAWA